MDDSAEADGSALDLDGDGTADGIDCAVDTDCDDDGTADDADAFPVDASETTDTDGDGTGNNADTDADDRSVDTCLQLVDDVRHLCQYGAGVVSRCGRRRDSARASGSTTWSW